MKERIKKIRKEILQLNQTEFGERLGVRQTTVAGWESGTRNITESTINLICSTYNIKKEYLKNGTGEPLEKELNLKGVDESFRYILKELSELPLEQIMEVEAYIRQNIKKDDF